MRPPPILRDPGWPPAWPWKVLEFLEFFPRVFTLLVENLRFWKGRFLNLKETFNFSEQFAISKTKNYSRSRNYSILEKSRSEFTRRFVEHLPELLLTIFGQFWLSPKVTDSQHLSFSGVCRISVSEILPLGGVRVGSVNDLYVFFVLGTKFGGKSLLQILHFVFYLM